MTRKKGVPAKYRRAPHGAPLRFYEAALAHAGEDCLLWPFYRNQKGYARIAFDGRPQSASRLICEAAYGPSPTARHQAAHSCGKGQDGCVNPRHLRWKTPSENQADQLVHGTRNHGSRNGNAKLTEAQVVEIRALKGHLTQRQTATRFGVTGSVICRIRTKKGWVHV